MDAKAPAAVTTFRRGCGARGHLRSLAVAPAKPAYGPVTARDYLIPLSVV